MDNTDVQSPIYVNLNVGGHIFTTTTDTLLSYPDTRLGRLAKDITLANTPQDVELFFDRNPEIIQCLLDLYRTGELHLPMNLCGKTAERELSFWEIPVELIAECCYKGFEDHKRNAAIMAEIDRFLYCSFDTASDMSSWNRIWLIMERPRLCLASKVWAVIYFSLVFLSVLLYALETDITFRVFHQDFLDFLEGYNVSLKDAQAHVDVLEMFNVTETEPWLKYLLDALLVFFTAELLVRFLMCPNKLYFIRQAKNWLDLFLVVHDGITVLLEEVIFPEIAPFSKTEHNAILFFYSLSVLRTFRILYLAKDFDIMKVLLLSTRASLRVLILLAVCVICLATLFGACVYLADLLTEKFAFSSIPYAMWYAIVTITTVGYGDVVPASTIGRFLGCLCALFGVIFMALPIAVLASEFSSYHENLTARRQKTRTAAFLKENPHFRHNSRQRATDSPDSPSPRMLKERQKKGPRKVWPGKVQQDPWVACTIPHVMSTPEKK